MDEIALTGRQIIQCPMRNFELPSLLQVESRKLRGQRCGNSESGCRANHAVGEVCEPIAAMFDSAKSGSDHSEMDEGVAAVRDRVPGLPDHDTSDGRADLQRAIA